MIAQGLWSEGDLGLAVVDENERELWGLMYMALRLFKEAGLVGTKLVLTLKRFHHEYILGRLMDCEQKLCLLILKAAQRRPLPSAPDKQADKPVNGAAKSGLAADRDAPAEKPADEQEGDHTDWPVSSFRVPDAYGGGPLRPRLASAWAGGFHREPEPESLVYLPFTNDPVDARRLSLRLLSFNRALETFDKQVDRFLLRCARRRNPAAFGVKPRPPRPWRPKPVCSNRPKQPKIPEYRPDLLVRLDYDSS
jgi:hypothetical protein